MNHLFRFNLRSDTEKQNALVVKLFGGMKIPTGETIYFGTNEQVMAMQVAHSVGISQEIVALLKNGMVYKYAIGDTMKREDISDPEIRRY